VTAVREHPDRLPGGGQPGVYDPAGMIGSGSGPAIVGTAAHAADGQVMSVSSPLAGFGSQLRAARLAAGISVRELARRVDVSPSFVSRVELGRTKPSVGTLYSMASELSVPLDDLMPVEGVPEAAIAVGQDRRAVLPRLAVERGRTPRQDSSDDGVVQRRDDRHELLMERSAWGRLTPDHDPENDFLHVVYAPGGQSCPEDSLIHHRGREYGFVVTGTLSVQVGFAHHVLQTGDSITFSSTTPHRLHNPSDDVSVSIWMVVGRGGTPVL
jgi:transcriptional regulator with XRE-family HTH domain